MVGSGPKCPFDCSASFPALSGSILATQGVASKLCDFGEPGGPRGLGAEVLTTTSNRSKKMIPNHGHSSLNTNRPISLVGAQVELVAPL